MEGLCQVLRRSGGTTGGVSNTEVAVSEMDKENLQEMIDYIKIFKRIRHTCTHADFDIAKVRAIYHQWDIEKAHQDPEVVPNIDPKDWPKTLEPVEEYIRGFQGVYGQYLSYGLRVDLEPPASASDPTHRANGSKYFTHDEEIIAGGSILSEPAVSGSDPEAVGPFTNSFITDRTLIWDNMVAIFQGSDAWTYLKPSKKHRDGRMGYKLIYNHYPGPSNMDHMGAMTCY